MDKYLVTKEEIDEMEGLSKTHFLNEMLKEPINRSVISLGYLALDSIL